MSERYRLKRATKRADVRYQYSPLTERSVQLTSKQINAVEGFPTFLANLLVNSITKVGKAQLLNLSRPAWQEETEPSVLMVRACYEPLFQFANDRFQHVDGQEERSISVIAGTAGIGKSVFSLYAAKRWFEAGKLVVLWWHDTVWLFTKIDLSYDPFLKHHVSKAVLDDATEIWYYEGVAERKVDDPVLRHISKKQDPKPIVIRDPGRKKTASLMDSLGAELYTVSYSQRGFLDEVKRVSKNVSRLVRVAEVWSHAEFVLYHKHCMNIDTNDVSQEKRIFDLLMEGYRRYGGSVRNVLGFVDEFLSMPADQDVQSLPSDDIGISLEQIIDFHNYESDQVARARDMVFHQTPQENLIDFDTQVASYYIRQKLLHKVTIDRTISLPKLASLFSVHGSTQDGLGVLYEVSAHENFTTKTQCLSAELLGIHAPSSRSKQVRLKAQVDLRLFSPHPILVAGQSLKDCTFQKDDKPADSYILPLATNLPIHDAFVLVDATVFFEPNDNLSQEMKLRVKGRIGRSKVLVGLQMTTSGNSNRADKPSHNFRGCCLKDHLEGIVSACSLPAVAIFPDVVTVFVSPTESRRKAGYMPVLDKEGRQSINQAIPSFPGMAPQYSAVLDDKHISKLLHGVETDP